MQLASLDLVYGVPPSHGDPLSALCNRVTAAPLGAALVLVSFGVLLVVTVLSFCDLAKVGAIAIEHLLMSSRSSLAISINTARCTGNVSLRGGRDGLPRARQIAHALRVLRGRLWRHVCVSRACYMARNTKSCRAALQFVGFQANAAAADSAVPQSPLRVSVLYVMLYALITIVTLFLLFELFSVDAATVDAASAQLPLIVVFYNLATMPLRELDGRRLSCRLRTLIQRHAFL